MALYGTVIGFCFPFLGVCLVNLFWYFYTTLTNSHAVYELRNTSTTAVLAIMTTSFSILIDINPLARPDFKQPQISAHQLQKNPTIQGGNAAREVRPIEHETGIHGSRDI